MSRSSVSCETLKVEIAGKQIHMNVGGTGSPLIYLHINPYGTFELDMDKRIPIDPAHRFLAA